MSNGSVSQPKNEILIRVKTLDGQSTEVRIDKNATVDELKTKIEQTVKIPKNRQRIIFQGRELPDSLVLKDQANLDGRKIVKIDFLAGNSF